MATISLPMGTPIWKKPAAWDGSTWKNTQPVLPAASTVDHSEFSGVTTRDGEQAGEGAAISLKKNGVILVRVLGPCKFNDILGQVPGQNYLSTSGTTNTVGAALGALTDSAVHLLQVKTNSAVSPAIGYPFQIQKVDETRVRVVTTSALLTGADCQAIQTILGLGQPFTVVNGSKIYLEALFDQNGAPILANICKSTGGWCAGKTGGFPKMIRAVDNTQLSAEITLLAQEFVNHVIYGTAPDIANLTTASAALALFSAANAPRFKQFYAYALIGFCTQGSGASGLSLAGDNPPTTNFTMVQCLNTHLMLMGVCDSGVPSELPMPSAAPFVVTLPTPVLSGATNALTLTVPDFPAASIFYSIDGAPYAQYTQAFGIFIPGVHTITAYATQPNLFQSATGSFPIQV